MNRKKLIGEYKDRKLRGGVYAITNIRSGTRIIKHAPDLRAAQNRFNFSVSTGSCVHMELQKEWLAASDRKEFVFAVLEELEINEGQSRQDFADDLLTLEQLWHEKPEAEH